MSPETAFLFMLHDTKTGEVRYQIMGDRTPTLKHGVVAGIVLTGYGRNYSEGRDQIIDQIRAMRMSHVFKVCEPSAIEAMGKAVGERR